MVDDTDILETKNLICPGGMLSVIFLVIWKIAGRNINNLRYADDTTLMAESGEELKILLMKVKRRVKKLA